MQGFFSEQSLQQCEALLPKTYEFTRCVRPDGSAYGTAGECRKGRKEDKVPLEASKKSSRDALNPEQLKEVKEESKAVHDRFEALIPKKGHKDYKFNVETLEPYRNLSDDEKAALGLYTREQDAYYEQVNLKLRTGEGPPSKEREAMVNFISDNLRSAISKLPPEDGDFIRMVHGDFASNLSRLSPGDVISDKGFGSFTDADRKDVLDYFVEYESPNAVIKVKGKNFRYISYASAFNENESEYLSPPGTQLRFVRKAKKRHTDMYGDKHPVYEFEEV